MCWCVVTECSFMWLSLYKPEFKVRPIPNFSLLNQWNIYKNLMYVQRWQQRLCSKINILLKRVNQTTQVDTLKLCVTCEGVLLKCFSVCVVMCIIYFYILMRCLGNLWTASAKFLFFVRWFGKVQAWSVKFGFFFSLYFRIHKITKCVHCNFTDSFHSGMSC